MKLKIGVMGSASGRLSTAHKKIAYELGCAIAAKDCITVTGACPGFPLEAANRLLHEEALEASGCLFITISS
jgi:hypothetical protein